MQVAARGPSGGTNARDDLACLHCIARMDADGLKVVVGGDEAVAMIDLHTVAAAPGMPSGRAYNTGVGCVDGHAAGRCIILAQVEIISSPADRADPEAERRTRLEELKRGHQKAGSGPARARRPYCQGRRGICARTSYRRMWEGQGDQRTGQDGRRKGAGADLVRRRRTGFPSRFPDAVPAGCSAGDCSTLGPGARN